MAQVDIELITSTRKALNDVKSFSRSAQTAVGKVSDSFLNLKNVAVGALAGIGISKFVSTVVSAAAEQEQAVQKLNTALALSGELSEETTQSFLDFTSALQQNSTVGDEVSLGLVGLTKSFGATNDQAKLILQTAADLSAVTGESLESSVRNLSKTLGGLKGELGETQPELRNLTKEQLQNGEAIDILARKYEGAAKALTKTFAGAVTQTQNSFGDLLEEIGKFITESPAVIAAINLASEVFTEFGRAIDDNRDGLSDLISDGILAFIEAIPTAIRVIQPFVTGIQALKLGYDALKVGILTATEQILIGFDFILESVGTLISGAFDPLITKIAEVTETLASIGIISQETADEVLAATSSFSEFSDGLGTSLDGAIASVREYKDAAVDSAISTQESLVSTAVSFEETALEAEGLAERFKVLQEEAANGDEALKKLSEANKDVASTSAEAASEVDKLVASVAKADLESDPIRAPIIPEVTDPDFINALIDPDNLIPAKPIPVEAEVTARRQETIELAGAASDISTAADVFGETGAIIAQSASLLFQGAEGARSALVLAGSTVADAFLPGLGQVVGPLIDGLSRGPEFVREQINAFVDALPELIENIAEALPVFIEVLAERAPDIIAALAKASPQIITALVKNAPEIAKAIIVSLAQLPGILIKELLAELGASIDSIFGTTLETDVENAADKISEATEGTVTKVTSTVEDAFDRSTSTVKDRLERAASTIRDRAEVAGEKIGASADKYESISDDFGLKAATIFQNTTDKYQGISDDLGLKAANIYQANTEKVLNGVNDLVNEAKNVGGQISGVTRPITKGLQDFAVKVGNIFAAVGKDFLSTLAVFGKSIAKGVGTALGEFGRQVSDIGKAIAEPIKEALTEVFAQITEELNNFGGQISEFFRPVFQTLNNILVQFETALRINGQALVQGIVNGGKEIGGAISNAFKSAGSVISEAGKQVGASASESFKQFINAIPDAGNAIADSFKKLLSGFQFEFDKLIRDLFAFKFDVPEIKIPTIKVTVPKIPNPTLKFNFSKLSEAITKPFGPIIEFFENLEIKGPSSEKASNVFEGNRRKIQGALGFNEGGRVPEGFPNDTFPARLTSGEEVIDRSTSDALRRFLAGASSQNEEPKNIMINLQVGERQLAEVIVNLTRQGYRLSV